MTTPPNVALFPFSFPGFGPDLSRGLAAVTDDHRLILAEAAGNPGTAVISALETAIEAARAALDVPEGHPVFYWEPATTDSGEALWAVSASEDETILGLFDWQEDTELVGAVEALRVASRSV